MRAVPRSAHSRSEYAAHLGLSVRTAAPEVWQAGRLSRAVPLRCPKRARGSYPSAGVICTRIVCDDPSANARRMS